MLGEPKTRSRIAAEYGISRKTLYNWIKSEKIIMRSNLVSPKEQEKIYKLFGVPRYISSEERQFYSNLFFGINQRQD